MGRSCQASASVSPPEVCLGTCLPTAAALSVTRATGRGRYRAMRCDGRRPSVRPASIASDSSGFRTRRLELGELVTVQIGIDLGLLLVHDPLNLLGRVALRLCGSDGVGDRGLERRLSPSAMAARAGRRFNRASIAWSLCELQECLKPRWVPGTTSWLA